ncbi:MAG: amidase [Burkholderiaceae bacterium]
MGRQGVSPPSGARPLPDLRPTELAAHAERRVNLVDAGVIEVANLVRRREVSAREVARAVIAHVEAVNPQLNALVGFDPQAVLDEADGLDQALARDPDRASLAGAMASVKDNLWIEGRRSSQGSRLFADFIAPRSALAVIRARKAGAAMIGASNCSEFACKGVTTNRIYGATRNPWDLGRTTGGSSGGAAAAVAAGLGHFAICTDGGGSTRRPASHTGVVGFKPSAGAIAHPDGFAEPVFGNSVIGLMARSVADVAAVFDAIGGPDVRDPLCLPMEATMPTGAALQRPFSALRVAFSPRLGLDVAVDPDVREALENAALGLGEAGVEVVDADPAWPAGSSESALMPLQLAGLANLYGEEFKRDPEQFDPDIAVQIEQGLSLSAADVARALLLREEMFRSLAAFFGEHDLLLSPTTPCVAWPLDELGPNTIDGRDVSPRAHAVFTPAFNHVFMPACSVPIGLNRQGLPIGAQIAGWRWRDRDVLRVAAQLESRAPAHFRRPLPMRPPSAKPVAA